ncbi:MAG: hypothetical protein NTW66_02275 [Candidatus Magasanikbacteria bacterium]|nr:hypothetical protein [Candidatus Magasanikbacteria bacterium]
MKTAPSIDQPTIYAHTWVIGFQPVIQTFIGEKPTRPGVLPFSCPHPLGAIFFAKQNTATTAIISDSQWTKRLKCAIIQVIYTIKNYTYAQI